MRPRCHFAQPQPGSREAAPPTTDAPLTCLEGYQLDEPCNVTGRWAGGVCNFCKPARRAASQILYFSLQDLQRSTASVHCAEKETSVPLRSGTVKTAGPTAATTCAIAGLQTTQEAACSRLVCARTM